MRLLFIENQLPAAPMLQRALMRKGHQVIRVAEAYLAHEPLQHRAFHRILLNSHQPQHSGHDLFALLDHHNRCTPVIVLVEQSSHAHYYLDKGAVAYLVKPRDPTQLMAALEPVLLAQPNTLQ